MRLRRFIQLVAPLYVKRWYSSGKVRSAKALSPHATPGGNVVRRGGVVGEHAHGIAYGNLGNLPRQLNDRLRAALPAAVQHQGHAHSASVPAVARRAATVFGSTVIKRSTSVSVTPACSDIRTLP